MDYQQPSFYKFNEDSILLSNEVIARSKRLSPSSVMDLGCGCGVIGIEVSNSLDSIKQLTLVEMQSEYSESIQFNLKNILNRSIKIETLFCSFNEQLKKSNTAYDLIVCNPPYFSKGRGRSSSNVQRQLCRTFDFDSPDILLELILKSLSKNGEAYIIIPNNEIQWDEIKIQYKQNMKCIFEKEDVGIYLILHSNSD